MRRADSRYIGLVIALSAFVPVVMSDTVHTQGAAAGAATSVAQVTDKSGSKMTVRELSLSYSYSYTRSNCAFSCGASSDAQLEYFPLNDVCGATMIPVSEVRSIAAIARTAYGDPYIGTITFADGRVTKTKFGKFGNETLDVFKGQSPLGPYSVAIEKTSQVDFQPDQARPTSMKRWGADDAKSSATVGCRDSSTLSLTKASLYTIRDNATIAGVAKSFKVKVGESEVEMAVDRLKSLVRKPEPNKESKYALTTTTGETIDVQIPGAIYLGGVRGEYFHYSNLSDIKELTLTN